MFKLDTEFYGDETAIYYRVVAYNDDKEIWKSGYYHQDEIQELYEEVDLALRQMGISVDLSNPDPCLWVLRKEN